MVKTRLILLILITPFFLQQCQMEANPEKPNIILFLIDDFGYADISYEGNTQIRTPGIDRIAEGGVRFTNFYQSSAACAPTRASLLTGRYHLETGVWGVHAGRDYILRDETTIADVLKANGYATGAFGKWHSGKTWAYFGWNRGFDVGFHTRLYKYFDSQVIFNHKLVNVQEPITDVVGDAVIRFIEENQDQPFFAYVPFQSIHEPFNCPANVFQKYKEAGYTDHVARLYGMIEVLDKNIGRILDKVDELGLAENSVIMFLADDGPAPGFDLSYQNRRMNEEERAERKRGWAVEHRGGKASIWEGGSLTPFYVRWDGKIDPGQNFAHLSGVIDLFPTILDMGGIHYENVKLPLHGRSIWPIIQGSTPEDWEERKYFDNTNFYQIQRQKINIDKPRMHYISVRYKNYKMIRGNRALYGGPDSVYYELYDLEKDPMESQNLVREEVNISAQLIPEIERWYDKILENERAFGQPVYEVGHWEEPNSPINVDGFRDVWGSLLENPQSGFRIAHWTKEGSGVNFEIDVLEAGSYQVELGYSCDETDLGSDFIVYTEYDTAAVQIDAGGSAISEKLNLPAGHQVLHIALSELGRGDKGLDVLSRVLVHRIPEEKDRSVLRDAGFLIQSGEEKRMIKQSSASADFLYGLQDKDPLEVAAGDVISILAQADNMDEIKSVSIYLGFDKVEVLTKPPFKFDLELVSSGQHTLNVEFLSNSGVLTAAHADIKVIEN